MTTLFRSRNDSRIAEIQGSHNFCVQSNNLERAGREICISVVTRPQCVPTLNKRRSRRCRRRRKGHPHSTTALRFWKVCPKFMTLLSLIISGKKRSRKLDKLSNHTGTQPECLPLSHIEQYSWWNCHGGGGRNSARAVDIVVHTRSAITRGGITHGSCDFQMLVTIIQSISSTRVRENKFQQQVVEP